MSERKLAVIKRITNIEPIEGADKIHLITVDNGWKVISQIAMGYKINDLVCYVEIDSWLSNELAPFLTAEGKEPKDFKGIKGQRLKTKKMKGVVSQGLLLPFLNTDIQVLKDWKIEQLFPDDRCEDFVNNNLGYEGCDLTELLGIIKYEPDEEFRAANSKGNFPSFIPKTDQGRVQNIGRVLDKLPKETTWYVEEKIEGQSSTSYLKDGVVGVCSRNLELKEEDNTFWNTVNKLNVPEKLKELGRNIALQCEQIGPGIQGNIYKLNEVTLILFDIFDIDAQKYLDINERNNLANYFNLQVPPCIVNSQIFDFSDIQDIVTMADGKSKIYDTLREGLIFRANSENRFTFKVISNQYLIKNDS